MERKLGNVNRKYKDTVFCKLFSDKKRLLTLYNAMNQTSYENPEELEIVTLEDAIYMHMKNDVAFLLNQELNLYEHQSTENPNLPLRMTIYAVMELQKILHRKSIYSSVQQKLPMPRFFVFYNGMEEKPEQWEYRLSDAFEVTDKTSDLEAVVHVYNINEGKNRELMEQCLTLREYSIFIGKIRKYAKGQALPEAVNRAVNECIRGGILKDFLMENRAEVIEMSIFEFNEEVEMELLRQSEREAGYDKGRLAGREEGKQEGIKEGEEHLSHLIQCLLKDGLTEQIPVVTSDKIKREELYRKYRIR